MFLAPIVRPSKIIFISTETQNVDLYSQAGAPTYPANILCFISANVTASTPTKPAFRTGTSWTPGTWIYVENSANVVGSIGNTGITGIKGTTGNAGGLGEYGAGGAGGAGRHRLRRQGAFSAASRPHGDARQGHRRRRNGLAPRDRRRRHGDRDDPHQGAQHRRY